MADGIRRFTDREVATILEKASEIDEREGRYASGSLSHQDLREIAAEVGISPEAVDRAVAALGERRAPAGLLGAPLVRRTVHDVPVTLDDAGVRRLLSLVEERTDGAGNVSEAVGVIRWTSEDRFASTQVSIEPAGARTRIQVVEKIRPRLRRVLHLVPSAWGVMVAGAVTSAADTTGAVAGGLAVLGLAGGLTLGRLAWTVLSARSGARVARLARALSERAGEGAEAVSVDGDSRAPVEG